MCGLLGAVGDVEPLRPAFGRALDTLAHRGPDGGDIWEQPGVLLGHRRLAILDLTSAADQPMADPESGTVIVFNGEIYNYLELREELKSLGHRFRTSSDTEVLLKAWLQWEEGAFDRLNGMWAFAIWDSNQRRLILARDRFGVKPLYHARVGGALVFASEPKALLALDPTLAEPDVQTLASLWLDSAVQFGDHSYYRRIRALPAASWGYVTPDDVELRHRRFWDYPSPDPDAGSLVRRAGSDEETFTSLFLDAVRIRLRSDVPVGLTLSGGLDSSGILAAHATLSDQPIRCFTAVYGDQRSEESWARIAAGEGRGSLQPVEAVIADWPATLQRIVHHMDGPGYTPAVFPLWKIMASARAESVPVLLEGQGGDELLGGYTQYVVLALLGDMARWFRGRSRIGELRSTARGLLETFGAKSSLLWMAKLATSSMADRLGPRRERAALAPQLAAHSVRSVEQLPHGDHPAQFRAQLDDHRRRVLPALLHYGDAISMAHGIEVRLPFMDYRLVEWVFRHLPALVLNGESKGLLRSFLRNHGMPQIAARKDKMGFQTPLRQMLLSSGGKELLDSMIQNSNAAIWDYFDRKSVKDFMIRSIRGDDFLLFHAYKLITIHVWLTQISAQRVRWDAPTSAVSVPARV